MRKIIEYQNWSTEIFEGFYESNLYNSDSLLNSPYTYDIELPEGYSWDIHNFRGYMEEVGKYAVDLLAEHCCGDVILSMKFTGISSPTYYNYSTDRICAEVEVDYDKLLDFCLVENRDKFDEYLRENFSDRDGFWSFVANNVVDFESESESESEKYDNVMLEYYLLEQDYLKERPHSFSEYREDLYEEVDTIMSHYICLEKDGEYFNYEYEEDDEHVKVLDKLKDIC